MDYRKKCPLCNSERYEVLEKKLVSNRKLSCFLELNYQLSKYLEEKNYFYELRYCLNCGTRYQANVFNISESSKLYSNSIKPKKSFFKQVVNYNKNLKIRKRTAIFLQGLFNSDKYNTCKALEVGAGWGFFANICKEYKIDFTTLEISDLRKDFHQFLNLKSIDSFNEAIKNGTKFDLIYSNQVLEHIADINNFMENCNKLLKKDGYFIAEYPSYNNFFHFLLKRDNYYGDKRTKALEHLQLISDKGIKHLINNMPSLKYINKFPIRKRGDRIKYFFQLLTPLKSKGSGFVIAKKIK